LEQFQLLQWAIQSRYINLGFVLEQNLNQMRGLPNFPGGTHGFARERNNLRQAVGLGGEWC
jgi:hypothetical protein